MEDLLKISFIPKQEFDRVFAVKTPELAKLQLISDMCRLNTLSEVKLASGHLGTSFSAMDIFVYLFFHEMNTLTVGIRNPNRDIFFSSKGHDAPGLYSVLATGGAISFEMLKKLRRLGGLHGHPDVATPGIETNTGSLGMGISKAKGMLLAKKLKGNSGRLFVMTGDGELHEGQIWESMQTCVHQKFNNVHMIVDHNKIQSAKLVEEIISLGDLKRKFESFGWHVERCDGHDFNQLKNIFDKFRTVTDKPKVLIADTVKGKGVSFMEGPAALKNGNGYYRFHAGAPADDLYEQAHAELLDKINRERSKIGLDVVTLDVAVTREKNRAKLKDTAEMIKDDFGDALVDIGKKRKDLIVLDGDLCDECSLRKFEQAYPDRFVENGIAEQDMVSMAGGLALQGFLPVVNSFGVFLASRANEQIYNNASERTKIIYACHFSGLIPAAPGQSHQSLRDISLFGAIPGVIIVEPCNGLEARLLLEWCVNKAETSCMIRLPQGPSPRRIQLPVDYEVREGIGAVVKNGVNVAIVAYGNVLLHEAILASELLEKEGISVKVINMPWINRVNKKWFIEITKGIGLVFVIDNHFKYGGLLSSLNNAMQADGEFLSKEVCGISVEDWPACGTPQEVLNFHKLNGESISNKIREKYVDAKKYRKALRVCTGMFDSELGSINQDCGAKSDRDELVEYFHNVQGVRNAISKLVSRVAEDGEKSLKVVDEQKKIIVRQYIGSGEENFSKTFVRSVEDDVFRQAVNKYYKAIKSGAIISAIQSREVLWNKTLSRSSRIGGGIDERIVELPLAFDIGKFDEPGCVLDAGSALNISYLRNYIGKPTANITHFTQSANKEEVLVDDDKISYVFGDLRRMYFKDATFDRVLCISTIEHIGMDNSKYGGNKEDAPETFIDVVSEMIRVLKPAGRLLITFPYGKAMNFRWFRVFDSSDVGKITDLCSNRKCDFEIKYYCYDQYWMQGKQEDLLKVISTEDQLNGMAAILVTKQNDS